MKYSITSEIVNSTKQSILSTVMLSFASILISMPVLANDMLEPPMPKGYATEIQLKIALLTAGLKRSMV